MQVRQLAAIEALLPTLQLPVVETRKQTTAIEQLAGQGQLAQQGSHRQAGSSGRNHWQSGRSSNWVAGSSSNQQQPGWLKQQFKDWQNFEERGSSPGQPALSVPSLRLAYSNLTEAELLGEVACNTAGTLVKIRQLEHSMHFLEQRSESGFSLPSEVLRKWWRCQSEKREFAAQADLAGMAACEADWKKYRDDAIQIRMRSGCFQGLASAAYYMCWRI